MTNPSTPTPTTSPIVPAPGLAPGPIGGLQVLLEALFIAIRPPALTLAIIPFCLNVLLLLVLVWGFSYAWPETTIATSGGGGIWAWAGAFLTNLKTLATAIGARLGTVLGAIVASLLLVEPACNLLGITDRLVLTQRNALRPSADWTPPPFLAALRRSMAAVCVGLFLQVPAVMASLFALGFGLIPFFGQVIALPFGLAAWCLAGTVQAWNLLDYPFSLAGLRTRDRLSWLLRHPLQVLGMGIPLAFCSVFLLPIVLPVGVIAASRLYLKSESPRD